MSIPLLVREMLPEEKAMVLSDWKKGLHDVCAGRGAPNGEHAPEWSRGLQWSDWWALVNHVIDRITLPTVVVLMACHRNEPSVSLAWVAVRDRTVLHLYCPERTVRQEPELAAFLERSLREHAHCDALGFNPFQELKR